MCVCVCVCVCVSVKERKKWPFCSYISERMRDRWSVAGAGQAECTVRTVHMAECTCSQLYFYEEPSTSFHSAGSPWYPPELQWARVLLSVSISNSSHLLGTRTQVFIGTRRGALFMWHTDIVNTHNQCLIWDPAPWTMNTAPWMYFYKTLSIGLCSILRLSLKMLLVFLCCTKALICSQQRCIATTPNKWKGISMTFKRDKFIDLTTQVSYYNVTFLHYNMIYFFALFQQKNVSCSNIELLLL